MKYKSNSYDLFGEYGIGYDMKGNAFYFDLEDYGKIKDFYWAVQSHGYVTGYANQTETRLHRYILNCPKDKEVDHIKHMREDCRKANLRICSHLENSYNMPVQSSNTSGYKGVEFHKKIGRWRARISVKGKRIELGHFNTAFEAHLAYCKASKYYHGEYSYTG